MSNHRFADGKNHKYDNQKNNQILVKRDLATKVFSSLLFWRTQLDGRWVGKINPECCGQFKSWVLF